MQIPALLAVAFIVSFFAFCRCKRFDLQFAIISFWLAPAIGYIIDYRDLAFCSDCSRDNALLDALAYNFLWYLLLIVPWLGSYSFALALPACYFLSQFVCTPKRQQIPVLISGMGLGILGATPLLILLTLLDGFGTTSYLAALTSGAVWGALAGWACYRHMTRSRKNDLRPI